MTQKDIERGRKFLNAQTHVQERQINAIKSKESLITLANCILEAATKAFECYFPWRIEERLKNNFNVTKEELAELEKPFKEKYNKLDKIETEIEWNKAQELWEKEKPELEKRGLITTWLKSDQNYKAKLHGAGRKVTIQFKENWQTDKLELHYWNSPKAKRSYVAAYAENRLYKQFVKKAQRDIALIKTHLITAA